MKKIYKYLLVLLAILIVIVIILLNSKEVEFKKVELSNNNIVYNMTDKTYLDTIVKIALDIEEVSGVTVVIKELKITRQETIEGELDLKAAMYGKENLFLFSVAKSLEKYEAISVVAHEIIHLEQFYSGQLIHSNGKFLWEGKPIDYKNITYETRPWEMEAFDKQAPLGRKIKRIVE